MQSNLVDGKFVPPHSAASGQIRQQQLAHEIQKLERELGDPRRGDAFRTRTEYAAWRTRASMNLGWLREEERQLRAWLQTRGVVLLPPRGEVRENVVVQERTEEDEYEDFWRE